MIHHYTYYSFSELDGRGYIGVRSCKCAPEEDIEYFGSYKDKTFKPTGKRIINSYATREEANKAEIHLHALFNVGAELHFVNQCRATSTGFCTLGIPRSEQHKRKNSEINRQRWAQISKTNRKRSKETRQKISKAITGENNPMYGKRASQEDKKKRSEANLGESNPMYGRIHSEETRRRMSEAQLKRWATKKVA